MRPSLRFGVAYDFRNPPDSGNPNPLLYAQVLDQVALADRLGFDLVWLTEHHFVDDGYLPSFAAVAGAFAARTSRIRISTDVALAPFHHPLKLAEDVAVLDNLSGGRIELGLGMGYAPHEFRAFGVPRAERVSRTEETIEILKQALSAEPVRFHGKRFQVDGVPVFPKPVQAGGIPLWMAAQSEAGARRAARFGLNLLPQGTPAATIEPWRREIRAAGGDADAFRVGIIRSWLVTDDPERDWPAFRAAERYRMIHYRDWAAESCEKVADFSDPARIPQSYMIGDVEKCAEQVTRFVLDYGITDLVGWAAPPGIGAHQRQPRALRARRHPARPRARRGGRGQCTARRARRRCSVSRVRQWRTRISRRWARAPAGSSPTACSRCAPRLREFAWPRPTSTPATCSSSSRRSAGSGRAASSAASASLSRPCSSR